MCYVEFKVKADLVIAIDPEKVTKEALQDALLDAITGAVGEFGGQVGGSFGLEEYDEPEAALQ